MAKILIACESSGRVREAFRSRGHDAWSCDLLPAEDGSPYHYQCDVRLVLTAPWDCLIGFPDCTYLTYSAEWAYGDGPYHQKVKPDTLVGAARRAAREAALDFFRLLLNAQIPFVALENPRGAASKFIRPETQVIHPYQFGDDASKATCLWLNGLPPLEPLPEHLQAKPRYVNDRPRWANQTDSGQNRLSPGPDRWRERSRTYPGIADAMGEQWGWLL